MSLHHRDEEQLLLWAETATAALEQISRSLVDISEVLTQIDVRQQKMEVEE